jgi:hypothetical protein
MTAPVVSLCDRTGNMVRPWVDAGYRVTTVDLQPATWEHPLRHHMVGDVMDFHLEQASIVFAFPPCTHLAGSGARWWKDKGMKALISGLSVVERCRELCETSGAPYMIENPVGSLSKYWRDPDYTFHPVHYAGYAPDPERDGYSKKTCLWTGGGFVMPDRKPGEPNLGAMIHRMSPSDDRADKRSVTPMGFARAVFEANHRRLKSRNASATADSAPSRVTLNPDGAE